MDGTHIPINKPKKEELKKDEKETGSRYFNWKGWFSVVLMVLVDPNYQIIWCEVGTSGRQGDATLFQRTRLRRAFEEGKMNVPKKQTLPGEQFELPYFILGDNAFALRT